MNNTSIGLTLSGGGSRGYAHIGVLKALEEKELKPSIISGTSMGAIIGALIANGYSSSQITRWAKNLKNKNIFHIRGLHEGLSSHKHIKEILINILPRTFEELKLPLFLSTTNLDTGEHQVFSSSNLIDAILASISIPLLFKPIKINGDRYVDGGLLKNLPASSIRSKCDFLIGSNVNHLSRSFKEEKTIHILDRCLRIVLMNTLSTEIEKCDLFLDPINDKNWNMLEFSVVDEIVDLGYQETMNALKELDLNFLLS